MRANCLAHAKHSQETSRTHLNHELLESFLCVHCMIQDDRSTNVLHLMCQRLGDFLAVLLRLVNNLRAHVHGLEAHWKFVHLIP